MFENLVNTIRQRSRLRLANIALAKGALAATLRQPQPALPHTWEFSAFSQNGEDGIIDYLSRQIEQPTHTFVEIGAADGLQNNSSYLAVARGFAGLMVEGDKHKSRACKRVITKLASGVTCLNLFVSRGHLDKIAGMAVDPRPDLLSLDIDGNDYYIAEGMLAAGLRPSIFAVEYNSAFGPEQSLTITYQENFNYLAAHPTRLYYGVSINGWNKFFARHGYRFVTVDLRGVNAFFIDPNAFHAGFADDIKGTPWRENLLNLTKFGAGWEHQFSLIRHLGFEEVV